MKLFPVDLTSKPKPSFQDDFGAPRSGGRRHEGTDVFAPLGTPVLAVDDGRLTFGQSELSGNFVQLQARDARYFYGHLSAFPTGPLLARDEVRAGDVIGFVGDTGNARGLPPHVHFEVHPPEPRSPPLNPFPLLAALPDRGTVFEAPERRQDAGRVVLTLLVLYALSQRT
jgi:murein DD-endopeptidase MepM/ murein hydrolase activator NlpD